MRGFSGILIDFHANKDACNFEKFVLFVGRLVVYHTLLIEIMSFWWIFCFGIQIDVECSLGDSIYSNICTTAFSFFCFNASLHGYKLLTFSNMSVFMNCLFTSYQFDWFQFNSLFEDKIKRNIQQIDTVLCTHKHTNTFNRSISPICIQCEQAN